MIKKQNMGWGWLSLALFGFLGICIKLQTAWISWFDTTGANVMPRVTWANTTIFEAIANLGSPAVSLLVAVLAVALTWRGFRTQAILFGLAQFGGAGLLLGFKMFFQRARPTRPLLPEHGFSFPSGHVFMAVIAVLIIWRWSDCYVKDAEQKLTIRLLGIIWIGLVAASRVYLRAHYPSDILGSLLLAGFWWPTGQFLINKWALKRQKEANEA